MTTTTITLPRGDWDCAVGAGLRMLAQRHLVDETDGLHPVHAGATLLLACYANSIAQRRDPDQAARGGS